MTSLDPHLSDSDGDDSTLEALSSSHSCEHDTLRMNPAALAAMVFDDDFYEAETLPFDSSMVLCPACLAARMIHDELCGQCGWLFSTGNNPATQVLPSPLIRERYHLADLIVERRGVGRYRGFDMEHSGESPLPVNILRQQLASVSNSTPEISLHDTPLETAPTDIWPSIGWEFNVLSLAHHASLPRVIDRFCEGDYEYLIEEMPLGQTLWDAWDDPARSPRDRFGWLIQIAEAMRWLDRGGAMLEELRPEMIVVTPGGTQAVLTKLDDLIPVRLTPDVLLHATPYTPPELVLTPSLADSRAAIYSFGAMVYALMLGRELTELDFTIQGAPHPFLDRFPDAHPLLGRLIGKTFCRDMRRRFPTEDGALEDPSGFRELLQTLEVCQRHIGRIRYDIGAWTTTGMYRSGNEDAYAVVHTADAKQDEGDEMALVILTDGMGGMDSGEVAAAMAVQIMRTEMLTQPPFAMLAAGASPVQRQSEFAQRMLDAANQDATLSGDDVQAAMRDQSGGRMAGLINGSILRDPNAREPGACRDRILFAMKEANRQIYTAAKNGLGPRGMGCTGELIYLDGSMVIIGHVGDSRVYHLTNGRFVQVTRDHTLVNRLIELGQLTPEEAEYHPRRSELQQAIGGRAEVDPELYQLQLRPGDWLMVCSDGLTNQIRPERIQAVLQRSGTAEKAARHLVNLANLEGATDNVTVVVIRVIGP